MEVTYGSVMKCLLRARSETRWMRNDKDVVQCIPHPSHKGSLKQGWSRDPADL